MRLFTDQELADQLGITVDDVRAKCRPGGGGWPCVKPKRTVWRFTEAMVEEIVAKQTVRSARKPQATTARTARSQARRAS